MSEHTYIRVKKTGGYDIDNVDHIDANGKQITLASEIKTAFPGDIFTVKCEDVACVVDFLVDRDAAQITTLDGIVATHKAVTSLDRHKMLRLKEIDSNDDRLAEADSYTHEAKVFSLSKRAQFRLLALFTTRNDAALVYPIEWPTRNGLDTVSLADNVSVKNFYMTAFAVVKGHVDDGNVFRAAIRAANTMVELDAVIDNR